MHDTTQTTCLISFQATHLIQQNNVFHVGWQYHHRDNHPRRWGWRYWRQKPINLIVIFVLFRHCMLIWCFRATTTTTAAANNSTPTTALRQRQWYDEDDGSTCNKHQSIILSFFTLALYFSSACYRTPHVDDGIPRTPTDTMFDVCYNHYEVTAKLCLTTIGIRYYIKRSIV